MTRAPEMTREELEAKLAHYEQHEKKNKRPFSDAHAQRVIAGQAREIDILHAIIAELRRETSK